MKYEKESCCIPSANLTGMSFEKKNVLAGEPHVSDVKSGISPMSFSKASAMGGESRPASYRLEGKKA